MEIRRIFFWPTIDVIWILGKFDTNYMCDNKFSLASVEMKSNDFDAFIETEYDE